MQCWILSGLIVDPAEIRHLLEGPMLESSTYRYILQQGIEQGDVTCIPNRTEFYAEILKTSETSLVA